MIKSHLKGVNIMKEMFMGFLIVAFVVLVVSIMMAFPILFAM